jgi:membrane glycosyltransferase
VGGNVFFAPDGSLAIGVFSLWAGTITMLALPRVLGVLAVLMRGEQHFYGGGWKVLQSAVLEAGLSILQAPLRMVAHSLFVVGALTGWKLEWKSPPREATDVAWREAAQRFAPVGGAVLAIAAALLLVHPPAVVWLLPVGVPLLLAVPFTVLTSRASLGERVRAAGWLLVPEESWSPSVLRQAWAYARQPQTHGVLASWMELLRDARLCAVAAAAMGARRTSQGLRGQARRTRIEQLSATPGTELSAAERMRFLSEPGSLQQLRAATLFGSGRMQQPALA